MNANAKKWIKALRSGNWTQTRDVLKRVDVRGTQYCCLGVASELYNFEHPESEWVRCEDGCSAFYPSYDSIESFETELAPKVREWLGLRSVTGTYGSEEIPKSLVLHNDSDRFSFNKIADIIESEPKGLFKDE